ncbi:hypothetical protein QZH41_013682 [Actinostola sp. cb2023]|nr:hypothetical protein QZH41_013682 [Actinostola sp. cb2023]
MVMKVTFLISLHDGDEDVVVCNNLGPPQLYENKGGNTNNWIKVQAVHGCLVFHDRMCDSYGARVQVMTSDKHLQTQEIGSNTHFLGQSELTAHFGLGSNNGNVTVRVTWPPASFEVILTDVRPNRKIRVHRPSWKILKQKMSFANLPVCPQLKVIAIDKQIVGLLDGGQSTMQNATAMASIRFQYNDSGGSIGDGECNDGRRVAPIPAPTNESTIRRFDGFSNNKKHVSWGTSMEDLVRDFPASYQDKLDVPSSTCTMQQKKSNTCEYPDEMNGYGSNRPSPRNISNVLFHQVEPLISSRKLSDMHAHFGQFVAHDTDFSSPLPRFEFEWRLNSVWMPISVPKGDVHFDKRDKGTEYLSFVRSTFNRCTGRRYDIARQQINKITSYIDGSVVYGDSKRRSDLLRTMKNGKMKLGRDGIIPPNSMGVANDNVVGRDASRLLVAGDTRANVQPGLIVLHTLFVREHNRLCDEYMKTNPKASDEEVFQYARRIVIAELQAITYREYLPALLGGTKHLPPYKGYDETINVGMTNTMATAAFRFGHSQVGSHLFRLNEDGSISKYGHLLVRDSYFVPERVTKEGGIEPILRGTIYHPAQEIDLKMVDDLRNVLFPVGRHNGLDLAAMNIQRGRDHGLPDYNTVRKEAGLPGLRDFSDLVKDKRVARDFKALYGHVDNIDIWVGGLAEQHENGSEIGRTFRTIVTTNFLRIRDGDRFWYERILSSEEIKLVNSLTLGRIIRLNTEYKSAPDNVFFSTIHCASVENHQCKPRRDSSHNCRRNSNSHSNKNETETEPQLVIRKMDGDISICVGLATVAALSFVTAFVFIVLWLKQRNHVRRYKMDDGRTEMKGIKNIRFSTNSISEITKEHS